eukprot:6177819-Pleurochrysis_carterae.AAC.5
MVAGSLVRKARGSSRYGLYFGLCRAGCQGQQSREVCGGGRGRGAELTALRSAMRRPPHQRSIHIEHSSAARL